MASTNRATTSLLKEQTKATKSVETKPASSVSGSVFSRVKEMPYRYGFYHVLRLVECQNNRRPRLGATTRPADDPIRLGQNPSMSFAPSTLEKVESRNAYRPERLLVNFFGLFGPNGPLPLHLTEYALDRLNNENDPTLSRFADIFHHRLLTLFYRAWANAQPTVSLDRPESDRYSEYMASFIGLGSSSFRNRDRLQDFTKLHYSGRLSNHIKNADGLRDIIADYFKVTAQIKEFIGQWLEIPEDSCWRLGVSLDTGVLGVNTTAGNRAWECQQKFRIVLGPLDYADCKRFLPGSEGLRQLVAIVRNYIGDELAWDVNLVVKRKQVPATKLGSTSQLGWTTWLNRGWHHEDAGDITITPPLSLSEKVVSVRNY